MQNEEQMKRPGDVRYRPKQTAEPPAAEKKTAEQEKQEETPEEEELTAEQLAAEEAERRRVADMTRTVQVSIEQILARAAEQEEAARAAAEAQEEPEEEPEEDAPEALTDTVRRGAFGLLKWLMLVLCSVLIIAAAGVAWLYSGATEDMIPQVTVTMDGQTLQPTAYHWQVPVIGNTLKRTYSDTLSAAPYEVPETIESDSPVFSVTPGDLSAELTVTDSSGQQVFSGTLTEFRAYDLTGNGTYTGKLVVGRDRNRFANELEVTGTQTYQFTFTVSIRPTVRLNTQSAAQGSVVSLRVVNVPQDEEPVLKTTLENTGFVRSSNGWIAYIPIPADAERGDYELTVKTAGYDQTVVLNVRKRSESYKDYSAASQLTEPYIGTEQTPRAVEAVLETVDAGIAWADDGFVEPLENNYKTILAYGTTEYVGRSRSQRNSGGGTGRIAVNTVLSTKRGQDLVSPADGRVLLAQDLGDDYGCTVVVEHGAGLKSIFYGLSELSVRKNETVKQGDVLGETGRVTVAEARIGTVQVDPFVIWRGQCDAVKFY